MKSEKKELPRTDQFQDKKELKNLFQRMFLHFDSSSDGRLDIYQFRSFIVGLVRILDHHQANQKKVQELLDCVDENDNGFIEKKQFQVLSQALIDLIFTRVRQTPWQRSRIYQQIQQLLIN